MSLKKAHADLDRALNRASKEGYGFGFIEGVEQERQRIIEILRAVNAYGLQVVFNNNDSTYQTEQSMDTSEIINLIEADND